MKSRYIHY